MRVGWLVDDPNYLGGAELSMQHLATGFDGDIVTLSPDSTEDEWRQTVDAFIIGNCVKYSADIVPYLTQAPVIKRVADMWPHGDPALREWILTHAHRLVFSSPLHLERFPHDFTADAFIIPPPIPLQPFRWARDLSLRRRGTIWLGQMGDPMRKGVGHALDWANEHREIVDFYGHQAPDFLKDQEFARVHDSVKYSEVPTLLASYERFLFLPQNVEPFGRTVIEALTAGCEVVTNALVGALWYLETGQVEQVEHSAQQFWAMVNAEVPSVVT